MANPLKHTPAQSATAKRLRTIERGRSNRKLIGKTHLASPGIKRGKQSKNRPGWAYSGNKYS